MPRILKGDLMKLVEMWNVVGTVGHARAHRRNQPNIRNKGKRKRKTRQQLGIYYLSTYVYHLLVRAYRSNVIFIIYMYTSITCYEYIIVRTYYTYHFVPCLPTFRFSFFFSSLIFFLNPGMLSSSCSFVCEAATCHSQQVRTYFVVRVLSACVTCTLPHLGILLFFYSSTIFFWYQ